MAHVYIHPGLSPSYPWAPSSLVTMTRAPDIDALLGGWISWVVLTPLIAHIFLPLKWPNPCKPQNQQSAKYMQNIAKLILLLASYLASYLQLSNPISDISVKSVGKSIEQLKATKTTELNLQRLAKSSCRMKSCPSLLNCSGLGGLRLFACEQQTSTDINRHGHSTM